MNNIAIIGYGWVGKSMYQLFPPERTMVYDPYIEGINLDSTKETINKCDVAFICVPTPNEKKVYKFDPNNSDIESISGPGEGALDISIVEEVVKWCECPLIVIRSTVNPGDCSKLMQKYSKTIVYQPEYLGETPEHPLLDPKTRPFLVIGGHPEARRKLIELYTTVYNANISIRQVNHKEAEVIKLTENRMIAIKVAACQELYDVCEKAGVDYYTIQQAVFGDDPRFNLWWTLIYPDKRGFNSKCIPKDVFAWCAWAESVGYEPKITRAILEKNKEWINQ